MSPLRKRQFWESLSRPVLGTELGKGCVGETVCMRYSGGVRGVGAGRNLHTSLIFSLILDR